jgi:Rrf2 family protein
LAFVAKDFFINKGNPLVRLNRKIEYALVALKYMTGKIPGELTTAKEISEKFHTPFDVTARVMQVLAQKALLRSEQGPQGGYSISKDLGRISFQDLLDMVEGPSAIVKCFEKDEPCGVQPHCNIISPINMLNHKLTEFYSNLSLKDLLIGSGGGNLENSSQMRGGI